MRNYGKLLITKLVRGNDSPWFGTRDNKEGTRIWLAMACANPTVGEKGWQDVESKVGERQGQSRVCINTNKEGSHPWLAMACTVPTVFEKGWQVVESKVGERQGQSKVWDTRQQGRDSHMACYGLCQSHCV